MTDLGSNSKAGGLKFLTPREVAEFLKISPTGVYRLVERRSIRFYRVLGVLRFDQADLEDFIRRGCVEPIIKMKI